MVIEQRWCPVHGRRTTAMLDHEGTARCDAPAPHRALLCDTPLDAIRGSTEGEDDDEEVPRGRRQDADTGGGR